ncbi:hypothetical protein [Streptomyces sp. NPDC015125]|uniref:hypothetical protein n=1 Tax=Streptomyces sp. NPDC015125 TaxID=3364938 RepID=UPI0036FA83C5
MDNAEVDTIGELDAALAAARHSAEAALATVISLIGQLYPGARYLTLSAGKGSAAISETLTAEETPYVLPARDGKPMLAWVVGDRPLADLPEEAQPLLGHHAVDRTRTLNSILTDCWRIGARFPASSIRRHSTVRLTLR